jgi:hypothetical protein
MLMASALGGATAQYVRSDKGHQALATAPTDTEWFGRFMTGLRARVGERRRQDAAISITLMIELQSILEVRWVEVNDENDWQEKRKAAENGVFFVWTYCGSLRGFETPNVLLHDLRQQIVNPERAKSMTLSGNKTLPHISLPLGGRFKARSQEIQRRIIDIAWETSSVLRPGLWDMRIIDTLEKCGIRDGWVFQRSGKQMRMSEFGPYFFDMLLEIQKISLIWFIQIYTNL